MSAFVLAGLVAEAEAHHELPMPAWVYGATAFGLFLVCLFVLWTFRNTAAKVPASHSRDAHAPGIHDNEPRRHYADPPAGEHN